MEKNITLTSDEVCAITLALQDKIMNTKSAFKTSGYSMSEQTKRRLQAWKNLITKINETKWK